MSAYTGPNLISSGLILCLDSANKKSYPGSGTNFFDLSGRGNHHTVIGSPTHSNGIFSLNGSTQGFQRVGTLSGQTSACTVMIWYSTTDTQELWAMGNNNTSVYLSASASNNYYHSGVGTPTNFVDLATVVRPDSPVNYRNGVFHMWEAKTVDFSSWTQFDWFLYPSGWQMAGNVSIIMVYNRVLSAAESATNFAAFRGRYGI